ncbi:MAG: aspartate dehydrogenase [Firmicutes bacterium]|nr:aspartate dehydrogenase [Bacillota bacterium]
MFLFRKKEIKKIDYNSHKLEPVLRVSICTGEKTAGFQDKETGKFHEYQLISSDAELKEFMEACEINEIRNIY